VRTDLPLADQVVQVGHACLEAGRRFAQPAEPCHLVVLSIPSAAHLHDAVALAELAGIRCAVFHEPDDGMGDTAACTEPIPSRQRRAFRRYPLWGTGIAGVWARGPPTKILFYKEEEERALRRDFIALCCHAGRSGASRAMPALRHEEMLHFVQHDIVAR
jgi:hypothetical protein